MGIPTIVKAKTSSKLLILAWLLLPLARVVVATPALGQQLASLAVTPAKPSVPSGMSQQFTAAGTNSDGSTQNLTNSVTRTSTNTGVTTITSAGLATGLATGSTTIRAASSSINGSTTGLTVGTTGKFVQWTAGDSGASSSETTYLKSVTTGNLMLVFSHWDNQTLTASVSDSVGNRYVPIGGPVNAGRTARFQAWYAKNIRSGPLLGITVTYSGKTTSFSVVDAMEYSGLDKSAPLDVFASASGSGTSQDSGASPTTTVSNGTIIGLFGYSTYASPYRAGAGFTFRQGEASTMLEDRSVTATGSYTATATSCNPADWAAFVIGFKSAIQPPVTLSLNPGTVTGGSASTATVRLNTPAPARRGHGHAG